MEDNFKEVNPGQITVRPLSLTILCILTFISAGLSSLGCFIIPAISDFMVMIISQNKDMDSQSIADAIKVLNAGWGYYMVILIFNLLSLLGALYMWNLKRNGFHFTRLRTLLFSICLSFGLGYLLIWWLHFSQPCSLAFMQCI